MDGQKAVVADTGEWFTPEHGERDRRLRVIFGNGTESDLLLRSLRRALNKDENSRRIVHLQPETEEDFSALSSNSRFWTPDLLQHAPDFLEKVSARAGVGNGWRGFHDLGLGIAFEHGIPDATLPIYYHESTNWQPLMRRV